MNGMIAMTTGFARTVLPKINFATLALFMAAVFYVYDISVDMMDGDGGLHVITEVIVTVVVLASLAMEISRGLNLKRIVLHQESELEGLRGDLAEKVRAQLSEWTLTPCETEVAWLMIKGFSFDEIAQLRGVKEKTARHQASSIYAKSNTGNRSEFTGQFLEHLLQPPA